MPTIGNLGFMFVRDEDGNWVPVPTIQGENGITPHIGTNGNWFIGDTDTGARADNKRSPVRVSVRTIISSGGTNEYKLVIQLENGEELSVALPDTGLTADDVVTFGSGKPSGSIGKYKQFYIDEDTSQLYIRTNEMSPGKYIAVGGFLAGAQSPSMGTVASVGNIYLKTSTGEFYKCTNVSYGFQGAVTVTWEKIAAIPQKTSDLENDSGFITDVEDALGYTPAKADGWNPGKYLGTDANGNVVEKDVPQGGSGGGIAQETDPTVPDWAKQPKKPTYTASEVGARPDTWMPTAEQVGALPASTKIPGKTSDLENDSGYITIAVATLLNYYLKTETYAKTETYSQTEVDNLISGLDKRLNAIADSDDTTLDQLSEIVAYIKANKSLIDSITTDKVNVADIVDNLTTADSQKPLSAAQGKALKALYDAIPAWAKAANKPTYSKSDVGLGSVDNVRQYSADNPPPYPVTSVNGQTGNVTVTAAGIGAATTGQVEELSDAIADKLSVNQGAANVGKILVVGTDGNLTLTDMPEGGASGDVTGVLDESNNILLTGNLADGTYTLKYENADGSVSEVGTITVGETNRIIQCEWIANVTMDGADYVDLGIVNTENTGIQVKFEKVSHGAGQQGNVSFFGNTDLACGATSADSDMRTFHGGVKSYQLVATITENTEYVVGINYENSGVSSINGTNKQWNSGTKTFKKSETLTLCKQNGGANYSRGYTIKFKEGYITEGTTVTHHYVPAYQTIDGAIGVYDTITETFIAATGEFTKGADVGEV